jgi:hypothetical protein
MGLEGFLWVWIMEDETFEHSITFCWVCFARKLPASKILYRILWLQEDERRGRIFDLAEKKLWMQPGMIPGLQDEKPAPKPLNHKDLYILRASFFFLG